MRAKKVLLIAAAVGVAGGAGLMARDWVRSQRLSVTTTVVAAPPPAVAATRVLVAASDLPAGSFVKPEHLRWQDWPTDGVPSSYYVDGRHSQDQVLGAIVRHAIAAGTPITESGVVKPGDRGFLAAVLEPGMRAATVAVDMVSANAGLIFPGDHVDVILTQIVTSDDGRGKRTVGETVLEDVRVLAVDRKTGDEDGATEVPKTVTVEVTPKQAEEVTVAAKLGELSLSLRSLARTPIELAARDEGAPAGRASNSHTWDSDVSSVLQMPVARKPEARSVTIVRPGKSETIVTKGGVEQ